jgi:hypothetical protein
VVFVYKDAYPLLPISGFVLATIYWIRINAIRDKCFDPLITVFIPFLYGCGARSCNITTSMGSVITERPYFVTVQCLALNDVNSFVAFCI